MNFVKNFKWQIVLVALGAALMMSGKAYSQEISNTEFSTPPTSASGNFNTPAPYAAANTAANSQTAMTPTPAMAIQPATQLEGVGAEGLSLTAGPLLAIGIIIVGGVVVKKLSANRRGVQSPNWNANSANNNALQNRKPQALHS